MRCLHCGTPLKRAKDGRYGGHGDNRFCAYRCGWKWANEHIKRQGEIYENSLREAVGLRMAARTVLETHDETFRRLAGTDDKGK